MHIDKKIILVAVGTLLLTGCSIPHIYNSTPKAVQEQGEAFVYNGIYFGENRDADFKRGVKDGCRTAGGTYTKNHDSFRTIQSYRVGWEDGRLKCKS